MTRPSIAASLALLALSFAFPVGEAAEQSIGWGSQPELLLAALVPVAAAIALAAFRRQAAVMGGLAAGGAAIGVVAPLALLQAGATVGWAPGFWLYVAGLLVLGWQALEHLSEARAPAWVGTLLVPGLFGLMVLTLWQVLVDAFAIPAVLLPGPARVAQALAGNLGLFWQDFRQTFLKSVLAGFAFGSGGGFLVAILVERSPFLERGLLPLGSLVSAIPIVGVAPIMVMWFGFDWQSKAAVIVVMTFFPMLVNTLAGLHGAGAIERDLMRSYAAGYRQTLFKLRLPAALPFIFNALKINSTLALIGAIVAEFFGTPVVGMGFRISVEIGRMNLDMVWATIAVAALAGSMFYGILALLERGLTFWHPSYREQVR
ncbi:MAG: ABC transporter permease [Proteobacteria bacterium]|nr:ABC transporter permease [Pseudomonadota bacterium]MBI3497908.1 ABC transporter permease [Pseudomonadota bacterium]